MNLLLGSSLVFFLVPVAVIAQSSEAHVLAEEVLVAQILVEDPQRGQSRVGEGAARDYFRARQEAPQERAPARAPSQADASRHMAIQAGTYISDKQHRWGQKRRDEDVGELLFGVTYRIGEWTNSMDLLLRVEFQTFDVGEGETPRKLSVMPLIAFPDARSGFPFYLGAGAGPGVFFKQARSESDLSLDYQIVTGLRFPTLFDWGGLIVETGIKGHVHLLSSGQFNGVFLTAGTVFNF